MPLVEREWLFRTSAVFTFAVFFACLVGSVAAQAPVNDIVGWPPGMLLLATVLYAGFGNSLDQLWAIDPCVGVFLGVGLPVFDTYRILRRSVNWTSKSYHFVPKVKEVTGRQACWAPVQDVGGQTRIDALRDAERVLACVRYRRSDDLAHVQLSGLLQYPFTKADPRVVDRGNDELTSLDYLHFAAIAHAVGRQHAAPALDTDDDETKAKRNILASGVIVDVANRDEATKVVEVLIEAVAAKWGDQPIGYDTDFDTPAPSIFMRLEDLAASYLAVVRRIRVDDAPSGRPIAVAHCNGSLWLAILGGALLGNARHNPRSALLREGGRLSFYLGDATSYTYDNPSNAYGTMVKAVLDNLKEANLAGEARASKFDRIVERGDGTTRRSAAYSVLFAGLVCQAIVSYFLSVGTSAGVWTSVAMANALFVGYLPDLHSIWRASNHSKPGIKMRMPHSDPPRSMVVATLHRSIPSTQDNLRPGLLLNIIAVVAASLGTHFQTQTRKALGFGPIQQAQDWVLFTAIGTSFAISAVLLIILLVQQHKRRKTSHANTNSGPSETAELIATLSTAPAGLVISGLALYFHLKGLKRMWPILDAITFVTGLPLGIVENGAMLAVEENTFRLILLNRWTMGAVASAFGTSAVADAPAVIADTTCTSVSYADAVAKATCTLLFKP